MMEVIREVMVFRTDEGERILASDIANLSPYGDHKRYVRSLLGSDLRDVEVSSVDGYQGKERPWVNFELVKPAKDSVTQPGFLSDAARLNVTIIRPQELLIVYGNFRNWASDQLLHQWSQNRKFMSLAKFLKFAKVNNQIVDWPVAETQTSTRSQFQIPLRGPQQPQHQSGPLKRPGDTPDAAPRPQKRTDRTPEPRGLPSHSSLPARPPPPQDQRLAPPPPPKFPQQPFHQIAGEGQTGGITGMDADAPAVNAPPLPDSNRLWESGRQYGRNEVERAAEMKSLQDEETKLVEEERSMQGQLKQVQGRLQQVRERLRVGQEDYERRQRELEEERDRR